MSARRFKLLCAALCLLLAALAKGESARGDRSPQLKLHRGTFDARTLAPAPGHGLLAALPGYAIIQFDGPITPAQRAALLATGVVAVEYLPDYAYLVRGQPAQLRAAEALSGVYARTSLTLADKLSPALLASLHTGALPGGSLRVLGWEDRPKAELTTALQRAALDPARPMTVAQWEQLLALPEVRWVEHAGQPRLLNDVARGLMDVTPTWERHGLFGAGQIVAVTDTGLDTGLSGTLSPDFAGRIVASHVLSPSGTLADEHGHGTHVAGSVAGAGVQSGAITATHSYTPSFAGMAPEARLVIQGFEADPSGAVFGLPADYYPLYAQVYADGARIHTNSWGDLTGPITDTEAAYGGYPYPSQRTDQFLWEHPDTTIFFAAGNSGVDGTIGAFGFCNGGDGVVDPDSLLSPATAKNVITVGAAESFRSAGGASQMPWILLSFCFGTQPIATDLTSNNPNGMAAFSSRGPTDDGRIKPDLVGPGTNIVSNRSHMPQAGTQWAAHETNEHYVYSGGTSMAAPLVAGVGTLIREWLVREGHASPSGALVKAVLLNTTHTMGPGQYGTGTTREIPAAQPNSVNGWGRADLGFLTAPLPYDLWVHDRSNGLHTGETGVYTHSVSQPLTVITHTQPLRVMLAWTDPPASLAASTTLVNDLDLEVEAPDGTIFRGNGAIAGDRVNNVEGVVIEAPAIGAYTVRVRGFNVPMASQPYALVVGGPLKACQLRADFNTDGRVDVIDLQLIGHGWQTNASRFDLDNSGGAINIMDIQTAAAAFNSACS